MTRARKTALGLGIAAALFAVGAATQQAQAGDRYYRGCRPYVARPHFYAPPPVVYYRPAPVFYSFPVNSYRRVYVRPRPSIFFSYRSHRHCGPKIEIEYDD